MASDRRESQLIERLMRDGAFRQAFLAAPEATLGRLGLAELAPAMAYSSQAPVALDARESRSGLGGLTFAAAVAAVGALEFVDHADAADAVTPVTAGDVTPIPGTPAASGIVPPVDPASMIGPNAGGTLHPSEYSVPDPEGAPGPTGNVHAGYDLFASAGAAVRAPVAGTVIEASPSRGTSGQIFGGVVKVQGADGRIWVFRHVDPGAVSAGSQVAAGQQVATVSAWTDGTSHVHIELWRTLEGGYRAENMDDPYNEFSGVLAAPAPTGAAPTGSLPGGGPPTASLGSASGVFHTVPAPGEHPAPAARSAPSPLPETFDVPAVAGGYPGDQAPPPAVAQWMGSIASTAGLPPELPVMASLTESGMRNLSHGDRDSVGFFQMRTGIWNNGKYAGYPERPELQMQWFIDRALAVKADRIAAGDPAFGSDPATFGEWIADVERPAEQYRSRYQLRLDDARALLGAQPTP